MIYIIMNKKNHPSSSFIHILLHVRNFIHKHNSISSCYLFTYLPLPLPFPHPAQFTKFLSVCNKNQRICSSSRQLIHLKSNSLQGALQSLNRGAPKIDKETASEPKLISHLLQKLIKKILKLLLHTKQHKQCARTLLPVNMRSAQSEISEKNQRMMCKTSKFSLKSSLQFACHLHATCKYWFMTATLKNDSRHLFEKSHLPEFFLIAAWASL